MSPRVSNLARNWRHTTREPDVADLAPDTRLDEERAISGLGLVLEAIGAGLRLPRDYSPP
jgi:hypothetical protein